MYMYETLDGGLQTHHTLAQVNYSVLRFALDTIMVKLHVLHNRENYK